MKKHPIDFGYTPPFKRGSKVLIEPDPGHPDDQALLTLEDHDDTCLENPLKIPLTRHPIDPVSKKHEVFTGEFIDVHCGGARWTLHVFRVKVKGRSRVYGVQYPSEPCKGKAPRLRQSSGVWGADE